MKYPGYIAVLLLLAAFVMAADDHDHGEDAAHGHDHGGDAPAVAVTQWTDRMELFMEYPILASNQPGTFIIHLTNIDGFHPVREGSVRLEFRDATARTQSIVADRPARDGIFTPEVSLPRAGDYAFVLHYQSPQVNDSFIIDGFTVYADVASIPHEDETDDGDAITFLKEQQWKIPFATAWAVEGEIKRATWAVGQVLPDPRNSVEIASPVAGILQTGDGQMPLVGSSVAEGQVLAKIAPLVGGQGWPAQQLAFEQARRDWERAQRLKDRDAIALRDFERIENEYLALKAGIDAVTGNGNSGALELTAAISGRITEWLCLPGQAVTAGQKLGAIVDPSFVLLQASVYESDYRTLGTPVSAFIRTGANNGGYPVAQGDLQVLSGGGVLNPATRTVPVILRVANRSGELQINQSVSVELHSRDQNVAVRVPLGALVADEGADVVYVQREGEAFEKRIVRRGPQFGDMVAIREGLRPGERVVTTGAYHVKLASTTAGIGHGHAH